MLSFPEKQGGKAEELKFELDTKIIGKFLCRFDVLDSTNNTARELASEGAEEGTVILAEVQRAGKGRLNREWISPKGGLWLSIILRPEFKPSEAAMVTLMAGVAVSRTLAEYDLSAKIKWPNDVLIKGKKVCGILTEMRSAENEIDYIILGLGINMNFDLKELPEKIRGSATTLSDEIGKDLQAQEFLFRLLKEVDKWYCFLRSGETSGILEAWKELSDTLGRRVEITTQKESIEGIAMGVDDMGALIVKTMDGRMQKFVAGECVHLSKAI